MYYKDFWNGKVLTEQEYLDAIEGRVAERLEDQGEFDEFLHEEYNALDIFNFNDNDKEEAKQRFEKEVRENVEWAFRQKYRECQGEPSNKRKVCIEVHETRKVIRELPESNFDEDGEIDANILEDILREFEEVVGIYGEDEDNRVYYEA